jgi:hypothetical protein
MRYSVSVWSVQGSFVKLSWLVGERTAEVQSEPQRKAKTLAVGSRYEATTNEAVAVNCARNNEL